MMESHFDRTNTTNNKKKKNNVDEDDQHQNLLDSQEGGENENNESTTITQQITTTPLLPDANNNNSLSSFFFDGAKPWFSFGSGNVDTTGKGAGPAWVPDESVTACVDCGKVFDLFNRKHHCRYCGNIFCSTCCSTYSLLPAEFGVREPQRTCSSCATELAPHQELLSRTVTNQQRTIDVAPASSGHVNNPISFSMTKEIQKASISIQKIFGSSGTSLDRHIPLALIKGAKGIVFLTVFKAGFLFSGKIGTGLVIAKLDHGNNNSNSSDNNHIHTNNNAEDQWSAPTAIALAGMGWGFQIGAEITDLILVLTTLDALDTFSGRGQLQIGAELAIAMGPLGRSGEASLNFGETGMAPCYAYSLSSGLFAGVSLDGAIISSRPDVNLRFYGREHTPKELLSGSVSRPPAAQPLYDAIQKVWSIPE
jgi:lipid-binding SYLF domain-containing protein